MEGEMEKEGIGFSSLVQKCAAIAAFKIITF